jgi:DNA-binding MarR family transcriptional regulator
MTTSADESSGPLLRHLAGMLERAVEQSYADAGLDYRLRYMPVVRALRELGPSSLRTISRHAGITHSAVSQTVGQMKRRGLVKFHASEDARERIVTLTAKMEAMLPALEHHRSAAQAAERALNKELSMPLPALLREAIAALERQPLAQRIERQRSKRKISRKK